MLQEKDEMLQILQRENQKQMEIKDAKYLSKLPSSHDEYIREIKRKEDEQKKELEDKYMSERGRDKAQGRAS